LKDFTRKLIRSIIRLIHAFFKIPLVRAIKQYDRKAGIVVMMYNPGKYKLSEQALDFILLACIVQSGNRYAIQWNKKVQHIHGKTVFLNLSDKYYEKGDVHYVESLLKLVRQLEQQGNKVFYSSYEIEYWENKARMHELFAERNVHCPETRLFPLSGNIPYAALSYPLLVKDEHSSGSRGVYKINSADELRSLCENKSFHAKNETLVVQQLLNMHKDIRVILVGDEIVLHYWRFNPSKEWKPTSTKHGSNVDFITFPEKWRSYLIDTFKKLDMVTGAFDVAWQNDDLETEPYILEISPSYDPNPIIDLSNTNLTYWEYKNKIRFKNTYDKMYVDTVYQIKTQYVALCLDKSK
jgi:glutathione synthase/RimK-type ligase-like ATP-grasp enzyme